MYNFATRRQHSLFSIVTIAIKFLIEDKLIASSSHLSCYAGAISCDDKFAGAYASAVEREGHIQRETRANLPKSYAQCYDTMQRLARETAHDIMYLKQEVEKIRPLVIINNSPPTRGTARIPYDLNGGDTVLKSSLPNVQEHL